MNRDIIKSKVEATDVSVITKELLKALKDGNALDANGGNSRDTSTILEFTFAQAGTNKLKDYTSKGKNYIEAVLDLASQYPLVYNEDKKVSAVKSLANIRDELVRDITELVGAVPIRTSMLPKLKGSRGGASRKCMLNAIWNPLVPVWAYVHYMRNRVPYEAWSLEPEDKPELVFGPMLTPAIIALRKEGAYDIFSPHLEEARKQAMENLLRDGKKAHFANVSPEFSIEGTDFDSNTFNYLVNNVLLRLGAANPGYAEENISIGQVYKPILNFMDLDAKAPDTVEVNEIVREGVFF